MATKNNNMMGAQQASQADREKALQSALDKTDIDEKIAAKAGELKQKVDTALEQTDIDDKILAKAGELKEKAEQALEKTDLDEKAKPLLIKPGTQWRKRNLIRKQWH